MTAGYLLLALIPVLVYARISLKLTAGRTTADSSVQFLGENVEIISDIERETFKICDKGLREACKIFIGEKPDEVYVRSPTPGTDVYQKYKWQQVQRILKPVRARILGIHTKPIIVSTREFANYGPVKSKFTTAIAHAIEETVSNSWSKGGELTVGQEITYNVNFASGSVGGTTSFSYASNWGNETTKSKSVTIGTTTGVEVELAPNQAVVASLTATHGTLEIEVDYEAHLSGIVFALYKNRYEGHYLWGFPIEYVLKFAGLPQYVNSTEKISIGFYTTAKVVVSDQRTNAPMKNIPAAVISPMELPEGTGPDLGKDRRIPRN